MEATRSISELKQYLDKFKKDMSEIDIKYFEEIPKFFIPNWPKSAGEIQINLWLRISLCPRAGKESSLLNLKRRFVRRVNFIISQTGTIKVCPIRMFQDAFNAPDYYSNSDYSINRVQCFIVFSQFLDSLCDKIIRKLRKRYSNYKKEGEEFNGICEAVKRSFEPLIPFVVADILSEEER